MPELFPSDAELLAIDEDVATGVPYIESGRSPYFVEFRRMLHRVLLSFQRANDLRVYQTGTLAVGVRPGKCVINNAAIDFAGDPSIAFAANNTHAVWLDAAGVIQTGTAGFPADRTMFLPLAIVVTNATQITSITDHRGESFLHAPSLAALSINSSSDDIDQVINGIDSSVTAAALNTLTGGASTSADTLHRHISSVQDDDSETVFSIINTNTGSSASVGVQLSLPNLVLFPTRLSMDRTNGFLKQTHDAESFHLIGSVHQVFTHEGDLTTSASNKLIGVAPIDGEVVDVILSIGSNMVSSDPNDGVSATVMANGTAVTNTHPFITSNAGSGMRSTDHGDGLPAAVKTSGAQVVARGDVLTVDLTRTAAGTISSEANNIVVLIVIRADRPE